MTTSQQEGSRRLLGLGPGGHRFRCPDCQRRSDVEDAIAAKVFLAVEILQLDSIRSSYLIAADLDGAADDGSTSDPGPVSGELRRTYQLASLVVGANARCRRCTLRLAQGILDEGPALIALPATGTH
jgi:hypothetical protein